MKYIKHKDLNPKMLRTLRPGDIIVDDNGKPIWDYIVIVEGFIQRTGNKVNICQALFNETFGKVFLGKNELILALNLLNKQEDTDEKNAE